MVDFVFFSQVLSNFKADAWCRRPHRRVWGLFGNEERHVGGKAMKDQSLGDCSARRARQVKFGHRLHWDSVLLRRTWIHHGEFCVVIASGWRVLSGLKRSSGVSFAGWILRRLRL